MASSDAEIVGDSVESKVDFTLVNLLTLEDNPKSYAVYRDRLLELRKESRENPIRSDDCFEFKLPQPSDIVSGSRLPPSFHHLEVGTPLQVRLVEQLAFERNSVWLCTVEAKSAVLDRVIAKFIQPSTLEIPIHVDYLRHEKGSYIAPMTFVDSERTAYEKLKPLQGGNVPRFYGAHRVTMPNHEVATMLIIEYVEGMTPFEFYEPHPGNPKLWKDVDHEKHLSKLKAGVIAAQRALLNIHALGVLHGDTNAGNVILNMKQAASDVADPDSWDVVFFDFEFSIWKDSPVDRWVKDDYQLQRMWWTEIYDVTVFTNHCCSTHWPTMRAWYDKGGPGIRVLFKLVATDDGGTEMSVVGEKDTTHIAPFSLGGYEAL